jgi:hypothetical protein
MAWKCPQCKQTNENALNRCTCGYAYYEVLGLKEDAPAQSVKQTYEYLIKVWKTQAEEHNALSRGKLDERVKKINDAYAVFRQISGATEGRTRDVNTIRLTVIGGIGLVLLIVISFFVFSPGQNKTQQPASLPTSSSQQAGPEQNATPQAAQPTASQSVPRQPSSERKSNTPDMSVDKTPEWAIESVKNSHVLFGSATVDTLVNKWTKENAEKLTIIGWLAKKVDEKTYLVTYTATDGVRPTGFYFEINVETGEIKNIAGNPELQQKYGIKGN